MLEINNCIVCGSDKDLDTELSLTIDSEKVVVKVCAIHAEDITPKAAKEAYLGRKAEIDSVIAQAEKLGLKIQLPTTTQKLVVAEGAPKPAAPSAPAVAPPAELQGTRADGVLPTSVVDAVQQRVHGISGVAGNVSVESHQPYSSSDMMSQLPDGVTEGKVKLEIAEGRQGQPLAIPAVRQDGLGTTRLRITKGVGDAELQRRFKDLASKSINASDDQYHSFGAGGYDIRSCPMCKGTGSIAKTTTEVMVCPKCKGSGLAPE